MGSKIVSAIPTEVANKIITRDRMIDILYFDMEKNILTRGCIELIHKFFSQGDLISYPKCFLSMFIVIMS